MTLFTMKMTDAEIKNLSFEFAEWYAEEYGDCERESNNPILYNEYAEYLLDEEAMDDEELMMNMYAVVWYYGDGGYEFKDWYEERKLDNVHCVEYEEWKKEPEEVEPIICEDCYRDFTDECDDRSSFEEIGKVQCMDCFDHPECEDCGEKMMLDSSEPYCDAGCGEKEPYCFKDTTIDTVETDICSCSVGGCVKPTEFEEQ